MDKGESKQKINELLDKYNQLVDVGGVRKLNEEMTKKDFILPLFEALGWNVYNKPKRNDSVSAEENISKKRVDYGFRIDGIPKFFLEAKALKEDLSKPKFVEQAINYAWHKDCTWAVLTDFESVSIFNAELKTPHPLQSHFKTINCQEFLDRFDELWLLSKEGFEQGVLDKVAENWGKKTRKVPIDKQLLADFTHFREILSKSVMKSEKNRARLARAGEFDSGKELDECIQRILDRLIFIRNCEDKELEEPKLKPILREWESHGHKGLDQKLRDVFDFFDVHYNSKIFTAHLCDTLVIEDEVVADVISGLYQTKDGSVSYDFSAIEADVLGNIYEQYLGHILRKTEKRATVKESHRKRREQGIYYTPTYIVDYIVKNTLDELLSGKKPNDVKNLRVLDPACGSGSFLIKAFDVLDAYWKQKDKDYSQTHLDDSEGDTFTRKADILRNNIFGVDLDAQAIEIAQLNLLLKIAEKGHRLPLLQQNIQLGNSLIDDPVVAGDRALKWEEKFRDIIQFDETGKLKEGYGFDIVIGNPPYINAIQLTKSVGETTKGYWKNKYVSARGTYDIYILFFEQALRVCKEGGFVSFITPNKYLSSPYGVALRGYIAENYKLCKVVDLSQVKVFLDPSVYPVITVIQKTRPDKEYTIVTEKILSENIENKKIYKMSSKLLTLLPENVWGIILSKNFAIIEKLFSKCKKLEDVAIVQATSTASESDEYSKHITENARGLPLINTGTIDRYATTYGITKLMNKGQKLKKPVLDTSQISEIRRKLYMTPKIITAKLALRIEGFLDAEGKYASINTNCIHTPREGYKLEYIAGVLNSKLISFVYAELFSGLRMSGGYFQFQAPQLRILPILETSIENQDKFVPLVSKIISLNKRLLEFGDKLTDDRSRIEEEIKRTDMEIDELVYKLYGITDEEKRIIEESLK